MASVGQIETHEPQATQRPERMTSTRRLPKTFGLADKPIIQ
jgi:hypothetical protein